MRDATPLTDLKVRKAKAKDKPYRLFDGDGLALLVQPTGVKSWQLRYRLGGNPQTWTIGKLDQITLAEARAAAGKARKRAADGEHLTAVKHEAKAKRRADAANVFSVVAADWVETENREQGWTPDYRGEVEASIRNHLSDLDGEPMTKITLPRLAPLLTKIKKKTPDMHAKVRSRLNSILWYAVERGFIAANPLPPVRRGKKKGERKHYPAITDLTKLGEVLRNARSVDACRGVERAHAMLVFMAQRVGEIVGTRWDEVDLQSATLAIPRERMKRKDKERGPHLVPIPPHMLAAMKEWREADDDGAIFVCPAPRDTKVSITREGVEKFYRRTLNLAGKHGPHSWRSAFSTICRDAGKDGDVVEAQLDHVVGSKVASAYDRAQRLQLRRTLLEWYEATLIAARDGADVIPMRAQ